MKHNKLFQLIVQPLWHYTFTTSALLRLKNIATQAMQAQNANTVKIVFSSGVFFYRITTMGILEWSCTGGRIEIQYWTGGKLWLLLQSVSKPSSRRPPPPQAGCIIVGITITIFPPFFLHCFTLNSCEEWPTCSNNFWTHVTTHYWAKSIMFDKHTHMCVQ